LASCLEITFAGKAPLNLLITIHIYQDVPNLQKVQTMQRQFHHNPCHESRSFFCATAYSLNLVCFFLRILLAA
jgi:hypothetical protein